MLFYCELKKAIRSSKTNFPNFRIMIGGDFNSTIGNDNVPTKYVGKFNDNLETNDNGCHLISMCHKLKLCAVNTMFQTKQIHRYTWVMPTGFTKRIDYFVTDEFLFRCTTNCRVYRGASAEYESDHRLLVLDMKCKTKQQRKVFFKKREALPKPCLATLHDNLTIKKQYTEQLDCMPTDVKSDMDPDVYEKTIIDTVTNATESVCPRSVAKDTPPPWIDSVYQQLLVTRKKCSDLSEKKQISKKIKNYRQKLKSAYFHSKAISINQSSSRK